MALLFLLVCLGLCVLFRCTGDRTLVTAALFLVRGAASGVFQALYVYTPEVYPTVLRSVGLGACSGMARTGAVLTPYVAQVLMKANVGAAVGVYVLASFAAAVVCFFLPVETKGRELPDRQKDLRR
jgi:nitrate/nitrite transporter NarK